ncbi:hypothetical protein BDV27DRAFT_134456 [Aspergillus caelatus]|uniref:Uncharacterized protein n=1 Tax=Aspergillus caelatus TaxID=61420 RepID=A0A5N6ZW46_9EURO|nr:uncharacterized protein BDV27DRAFT_134456 [Aspergillus caelatus]KAE8360490.1 hypothetical protein BDV27DRAFT_134456 [Aspergillus caelatus]
MAHSFCSRAACSSRCVLGHISCAAHFHPGSGSSNTVFTSNPAFMTHTRSVGIWNHDWVPITENLGLFNHT